MQKKKKIATSKYALRPQPPGKTIRRRPEPQCEAERDNDRDAVWTVRTARRRVGSPGRDGLHVRVQLLADVLLRVSTGRGQLRRSRVLYGRHIRPVGERHVPGGGGGGVAQISRRHGHVHGSQRAARRVQDAGHRGRRGRAAAVRRPRDVRRGRVVHVDGAHRARQRVPPVPVRVRRPTGGRDRVLRPHVLAEPVRVPVRDAFRAAVLRAVHEVRGPQQRNGGHRRVDRGRPGGARGTADDRPPRRRMDTVRRRRRRPAVPPLLFGGHRTAAGRRRRTAPVQAPADPRGHGLHQARVRRAHRSVAVQLMRDGPVRRLLPPEELGRTAGRRHGHHVHSHVARPVHIPVFRNHHDGGHHCETGQLIL